MKMVCFLQYPPDIFHFKLSSLCLVRLSCWGWVTFPCPSNLTSSFQTRQDFPQAADVGGQWGAEQRTGDAHGVSRGQDSALPLVTPQYLTKQESVALRGPDERHKQPSSPPGDTRVYFLTQGTLALLSPAHCLPSVFKMHFYSVIITF